VYSDFDFIVFSFNFSSVVVCIFHFYCSVFFLVFVLPSGVIKNDKKVWFICVVCGLWQTLGT